jgi:RsiW-degrading membrane proteinase PrsW (M82 family)
MPHPPLPSRGVAPCAGARRAPTALAADPPHRHALFVVLTRATIDAQNVNLVPSVIVVGSFLISLAFVMYVYERATEVPLPLVSGCFVTGGILGVTAASVLEYRSVLSSARCARSRSA